MDRSIYNPFDVDMASILEDDPRWSVFQSSYSVLPENIKDILVLEPTTMYLYGLSLQYGLNEDQSANISRIIRDILLVQAPIINMPQMISNKLGLDIEQSKQIANKIVSELFAPAIEDIKKMQREKFGQKPTQPRQTQPQANQINQNNIINLKDKNR